ncbi:hypothetical protein GCM10010435_59910 [Winogradskya consettensis]|uniref:OmpR/PhoB-type domain-containing protein n=1 Tax=Winogradskya consettensis TaxID=113560 RepID=A0A919W1G6_9ACTN|nr:BTAD domain-containing putative transcriptional regulator [Actinoplanes consettensis]GIM76483.1 hypothetical protein Aco04nite_50650 [Actinoplanes consettensis]
MRNAKAVTPLYVQVMGPLRVWRDEVGRDAGPRQQQCLLALLAVLHGRPVSMGDLVDRLWGTEPPASAVNTVHKYVGGIRRLLEPGLPRRASGAYLTRDGTGYRFIGAPETLDLVRFRRLVAEGKAAAVRGHADGALDSYLPALRLCQGAAGVALAGTEGALATFAAVDSEFFDAAVDAASMAVRAGRATAALPALRLAAEMGRLHEPVHASLVTTLAAAGHRTEALARYRKIRDRLADELGIDPGHELREVRQSTLLRTAPMAVRPAQLPPDQPLFSGRAGELRLLRDLTRDLRTGGRAGPMIVAVDGLGGVGKSALVTRFAHLVAEEFADGQLFLDLRGRDGVPAAEGLRCLLYALGVRASDFPDTAAALVGMYRSLTAGRNLLLVLDDAHDASQVRPLLPNSGAGLVLVTSRRPLIGLAASDGARLIRIHPPDLPEARELLRRRLSALQGPGAGDTGTQTLDEIAERCGRMPLALALLAARLGARPHLPDPRPSRSGAPS